MRLEFLGSEVDDQVVLWRTPLFRVGCDVLPLTSPFTPTGLLYRSWQCHVILWWLSVSLEWSVKKIHITLPTESWNVRDLISKMDLVWLLALFMISHNILQNSESSPPIVWRLLNPKTPGSPAHPPIFTKSCATEE